MKDSRIKICHVQLLPIMSGVQRSMLELLSRMDPSVYNITVICKEEGDLTRTLQNMGIAWKAIPKLVRPIAPLEDINAFFKLYAFFRSEHFSIVHTHSSKTGFLGRAAARLAGVPLIFHTMHGLPFHEFSHRHKVILYSAAEHFAGRFSNRVLFVNHEERELVLERGILPPGKAITIYNGVNLALVEKYQSAAQRSQFRQSWKIKGSDFVIGYVGRLWEQKDPETLMRIIELCADLPVRFLIVGDGPHKERFDRRFRDDKRVIMTGWIDDPMAMYPAIDALILPSLWEGLSVTLIEAMAFAKPLIASNIKGNRECVWEGENGFLCQPRNPEEFHAAIARLAADPALYQRMSRSGREKAITWFDAEKNIRQVIALYEQELAALR